MDWVENTAFTMPHYRGEIEVEVADKGGAIVVRRGIAEDFGWGNFGGKTGQILRWRKV